MPRLDLNPVSQPIPRVATPAASTDVAKVQFPPKAADSPPPAPASDQVNVQAQGTATPSVTLEPEEPQYTTYTVKHGDTLGKIAKSQLGNTNRHPEIFEANRDQLRNPNDLRIGMTLKIPVPPGSETPAPVQPTPPTQPPIQPTQPTPPPAEPPTQQFTEYTVRRGDSLGTIALRMLGNGDRYEEIFDANRDKLKNPNALQPGMVLRIPTPGGQSSDQTAPADGVSGPVAVDDSGLTEGAKELLGAMQRYQEHHREAGNAGRTKTTPAEMREIAIELDAAGRALGVDPKMMLALYAHESGGINPKARSHTGAGGLGQLTGVAIRQVHFMSGIAKGYRGEAPYNQYKGNFVQRTNSINLRYDIKANIWTTVAYMKYELEDRAHLGRGVKNALKRYGDPNVSTYADKVNKEYQTLFGGKLF